MEIFLRDPAGVVPKGVPPDKSVGAWPSVQEKTIGIGNVGKSLCGGTNDEHRSLKEQGSLCEHSEVDNQEDNPTGERSGKYSLPRPCSVPASSALDLKESNSTNPILLIQRKVLQASVTPDIIF